MSFQKIQETLVRGLGVEPEGGRGASFSPENRHPRSSTAVIALPSPTTRAPPLPTSYSQVVVLASNGVAKGILEEGIVVMMVYIGCCIGWDWSPSPG
ncbi:hypothetical protein DsansV1_C11g0108841 [Dioscorea sansibarensis]